jgi:hypothetical protein
MTKEQSDQAKRELGFPPPDDEQRYVETTYKTIDGGSVTYRTQVTTRQIKPKGAAQ